MQNSGVDTKEDAIKLVKALGSCKKNYRDDFFTISKEFGVIQLDFLFYRHAVCTRKVIGTEKVPEEITPAYQKEIVEWECHPVLSAE
jgi:hypothetical protein